MRRKACIIFGLILSLNGTLSQGAVLKSEVEDWYIKTGGVKNDTLASNGAFVLLSSASAQFRLPQEDEYGVWARISGKGTLFVWFGEDKENWVKLSSREWKWLRIGTAKGKEVTIHLSKKDKRQVKVDCIGFSINTTYRPQKLERSAKRITPTGALLSLKGKLAFGPQDRTRVNIDEHNNIIVNGIPFFPIFFWTYDTHHNSVQGQNIVRKSITEPATSWNTGSVADKIFLVPAQPYPSTPHWEKINEIRIPSLRNHPQLLVYFMEDEPKGRIENWKDLNDLLHKLDPDHPTFISVPFKVGRVKAWKDLADIHGFGRWRPGTSIEYAAYVLDAARLILEDNKPIWPVFHPWPIGGYNRGHLVSYEEISCAVFTAIVHGAKGLTFYSSRHIPEYKKYWPKNKRLPTWDEVTGVYKKMGQIIARVQSLKKAISASYPKQMIRTDGDGGRIHYILKGVGSVGYLIATNPSLTHEISVIFDLSPLAQGRPILIYDVFEGTVGRGAKISVDEKKVVFRTTFPPLGVRVYRIESALGLEFKEETRQERLQRIRQRIKSYKSTQP